MASSDEFETELQALLKFMYMVPVGIVQTTIGGDISLINPAAANLLMPMQTNGTLVNLFSTIAPAFPEIFELVNSHTAASGMICRAQRFDPFFRARRFAEQRTYEATLLKIDAATLMCVISDVTEAARREEQIRLGAAWYNALLNDHFAYGILTLCEEGTILSWNQTMAKLLDYDASEIVGQSCSVLFADENAFRNRLPNFLYEASESGWTLQSDWCVSASGKRFWASYIISVSERAFSMQSEAPAIPMSGGAKMPKYELLLRDIDKHVDASAKMLHATKVDFLTGILNRRAFFDSAAIEVKRWQRFSRPLCVLAVDADHFKSINDRYGHEVGDQALQKIATVIRDNVRQTDVAARIGGEEFAILLPYTDMAAAIDLAERIRSSIEAASVETDSATISVTVSIGIAKMSPQLGNINALMKGADRAMYMAKQNGRNQVVCDADVLP